MKAIFLYLLLFFSGLVAAEEKVLNVYNWTGYLPDRLIRQFEKETGINVNYATYGSNEVLYAKLKVDPKARYDIVVPSTYFIDRMRKQDMIQKIDKSKLPNLKNLNPVFLNKAHDPNNDYSVPYLWSTTAIALNDKYHNPASITHWADFWKSEYKNQLLMLDDTREVFSMALMTLGYPPNDTDPEHIKQAYQKLKTLMPNVKLFNTAAVQAAYIDEDITLGMGWGGDIYLANKENPHIRFIFPQDGFIIALDSIVIPKNAPHVENAHRFINFLLRPEIAKQISEETGFATPNKAGQALLPESIRTNPIMYPDDAVLKRGFFQTDVGSAVTIYEKYFELLKLEG